MVRVTAISILLLLLTGLELTGTMAQTTVPGTAPGTGAGGTILYVDAQAADEGDGRSWQRAFKKITDALAVSARAQIWVADGSYPGPIKLPSGTRLYGGFQGISHPEGGESRLEQRDWTRHRTLVDAQLKGSAITILTGSIPCVVDGFTISNGLGVAGGGICCQGSAVIVNNTITGNNSAGAGGGIRCDTTERVDIVRNFISQNAATGDGGGIYICGGKTVVSGNMISGNQSRDGGGIYGDNLPGCVITGNTICDNKATDESMGGGISCRRSSLAISNNIVCYNSTGISLEKNVDILLSHNCVSQNGENGYLKDAKPAVDDIFPGDPFGTNPADRHCHLAADSPCIGRGSSEAPGLSTTDIDLQTRISSAGDSVDIGADEYKAPPPKSGTRISNDPTIPKGAKTFGMSEWSADGFTKTETNDNGTKSVYTHDEWGRVRKVEHFGKDGKLIASNSYTLDGVGNPTAITTNGKTTTYEYDAMNRMVRAGDKTYKYDWVGNRLIPGVSYNAVDQMITPDGRYQYGPTGDLIKQVGPDGQETNYTYDERGNLSTVR